MKIAGIQNVTLIDYPSKIACTIFLLGCNFRCGFCHNPELVVEKNDNEISQKEVLSYLEKKRRYLDGVCITGGEPLLSLDKDFVKRIKALGYLVKLDTNGSFPERLKEFVDDDLIDFVAMDVKASRENYSKVVCANVDITKVEESIKIILNSGIDYEFRTTIVLEVHDISEMLKIAEWLRVLDEGGNPKRFVLQGFRNQGKFIDEKYKLKKDVEKDFLLKLQDAVKSYFGEVEVRV